MKHEAGGEHGGAQGLDDEAAAGGDKQGAQQRVAQLRAPAVCHLCWQPGHRKGSELCSRYGKDALPKPKRARIRGAARGQVQDPRPGLGPAAPQRPQSATAGDKEVAPEAAKGEAPAVGVVGEAPSAGAIENDFEPDVCKVCKRSSWLSEAEWITCGDMDCDNAFHVDCLGKSYSDGFVAQGGDGPAAAAATKWLCPYCFDHAVDVSAVPRIVGNPAGRRAVGRPEQARHKSAIEPTNAAKRARYAAAAAKGGGEGRRGGGTGSSRGAGVIK